MNCELIQNKIDDLIFDNGINPEKEIMAHLESCINCNEYYNECLKSKQFMQEIKDIEPVLDRPDELTDSIMRSIANEASERQKYTLNIVLLTRLLAAAVIALLLTLGIEQYIVLNKMLILETELGNVQLPNSTDRTRIYKATLVDLDLLIRNLDNGISLKKIKTLMRFKQAKQLNFTFSDIDRNMIKDRLKVSELSNQILQNKY